MRIDPPEPIAVALLGSRGIPARYGGFETLVETLAAGLPKNKFRVTVFCESSLRKLRPSIPGINFVYFPVLETFRIASEVFYDVVSLVWVAFAPVHVAVLFAYTASLCCFVPRLFGKKVFVNVDGLEWKREKFPRPVRVLLRLAELITTRAATGIICDSHAVQEYYRRQYHADSSYAPNPAFECREFKSSILTTLGLEPNSYYLVVARLEPENHVDTIINGFMQSETRKRLVIVGPIIRTRYVEQLLRIRTDRIMFVGGIYDRPALCTLRREAFAYIHGHEVGGTNPSLLESMASASPTIAFDVPFNREVAKNTALYFRNARELAKRIRALEHNSMRRRKMAAGARRIASQDYSMSKVINRYAEIILQTLQ